MISLEAVHSSPGKVVYEISRSIRVRAAGRESERKHFVVLVDMIIYCTVFDYLLTLNHQERKKALEQNDIKIDGVSIVQDDFMPAASAFVIDRRLLSIPIVVPKA